MNTQTIRYLLVVAAGAAMFPLQSVTANAQELIGQSVVLSGRIQATAGSIPQIFDLEARTVTEPGVEYPSLRVFNPAAVDAAVNVAADYVEISFANETKFTNFSSRFFNGYSLKTESCAIKFTSVTIDPATTNFEIEPSAVTFSDNEVSINMQGLDFDPSSLLRLKLGLMNTGAVNRELEDALQELYIGILGRAGDRPGLDYWLAEIITAILTLENTRAAFTDPAQAEYTEIYGGLDNTQLVTATYENFLERFPEQAGLLYWVGELDAGRVNPDQMINAVINAVRDPDATGDQAAKDLATLDNKLTAAICFTAKTKSFMFDLAYREMARAVIANVTDDPETLAAAKALIEEYVGN